MKEFKVRIEGTRPLLHHAPNGIGVKKARGEQYNPEDDAKAALYLDKSGTIIQPSLHLLMAIRKVAGETPYKGRKTYAQYVLAGLELAPFEIPLLSASNGHAPEYTIDLRPVTVQRARIMRARPRFDDWALEFSMTTLDAILEGAPLEQMLSEAGKYVGIGDYRPLFGLFRVASFEEVK